VNSYDTPLHVEPLLALLLRDHPDEKKQQVYLKKKKLKANSILFFSSFPQI
jgi:hypothetical protein